MIANYIIPFSVNNLQVSIRTQVAFSKEYCRINGVKFKFPKTENWYSRDYNEFKKLLGEGCTDIIIYSKMLVCTDKCREILEQEMEARHEYNPRFHITYSNQIIDAKTLLANIKEKIRNNMHSMNIDVMLKYLKTRSNCEPPIL